MALWAISRISAFVSLGRFLTLYIWRAGVSSIKSAGSKSVSLILVIVFQRRIRSANRSIRCRSALRLLRLGTSNCNALYVIWALSRVTSSACSFSSSKLRLNRSKDIIGFSSANFLGWNRGRHWPVMLPKMDDGYPVASFKSSANATSLMALRSSWWTLITRVHCSGILRLPLFSVGLTSGWFAAS